MSTVAGLQVPVIPLVDVFVNDGTASPAHIVRLFPKVNVGGILGLTVTVKVTGEEHCHASGVKVYVPEFWLSTTAGLHEPAIALVEVPGKVGTASPAQMVRLLPKLNTGTTIGLTVTVYVAGRAH